MGEPADAKLNPASAPDLTDLFPLPLSPFEKFIIWDETDRQPMTFFIELHFASELDLDRLAASLADAIARNPLLAARIAEHQGQLQWIHDSRFQPTILTASDDPPIQDGRPRPIDLSQECGLRVWYTVMDCGSRLLFQVHHACCDGIGMRNYLLQILAAYAALQPGAGDANFKRIWSRLETSSLLHRFDFSQMLEVPPAKPLTTWQRLKNAHYFHFRTPEALHSSRGSVRRPKQADNLARSSQNPLQHVVIDRQLSQQIFARIRAGDLTVNDVGLGLLFKTCYVWNQEQGRDAPESRIRLMMPYDLRARGDLRLPACNRLSFSFLGRTHAQCRQTIQLIQSVHDEIEAIRRTRLPLDFLASLHLCNKWPRLAKWVIRRNRNMATAVLTYGGDVMRAMNRYFPARDDGRLIGDVLLQNVLAAPPIRENTNISIGLCSNWGQLCMSAAWNRDALTAEECRCFLDMYRQRWIEWCG